MINNWSLKGKTYQARVDKQIATAVYKASDIEILRKKIIKDVKDIYGELDAELLKELINTRFGYEE